jgi:hypothetical protein
MAKIETFTTNPDLPPDHAIEFINLGASVGLNGVNRKEDVMVVQALLKCALESHPHFKDVKFPEPNGSLTRDLIKIIKNINVSTTAKTRSKSRWTGGLTRCKTDFTFPAREDSGRFSR